MQRRGVARDLNPFLMAEYRAMQDRLVSLKGDLARTEAITPFAAAALFAWAFAQERLGGMGRLALFWIPVAIILLSLVRLVPLFAAVDGAERYLLLLETELARGSGSRGYRAWLFGEAESSERRTPFGFGAPLARMSRYAFWFAMVAGSLCIAAMATVGPWALPERSASPVAAAAAARAPATLAPIEGGKGPSGRPSEP